MRVACYKPWSCENTKLEKNKISKEQLTKASKKSFKGKTKVYLKKTRDFPGGPVVKNLPSNTGDISLIPGFGTKIPHAAKQLSPCTTTTEPKHHNERSPCTAMKTQSSQNLKKKKKARQDEA